ncbi:unnamed protein product [Brassicogethes aeneus]|uniref:Uncharacterized protein n=1 Tax=Brassicogethes aeneus TaxID=1431903 RepID=A0A9P0BFU0_BRAAE|nr:unnamed protein product [Brassicogethes aeneus]
MEPYNQGRGFFRSRPNREYRGRGNRDRGQFRPYNKNLRGRRPFQRNLSERYPVSSVEFDDTGARLGNNRRARSFQDNIRNDRKHSEPVDPIALKINSFIDEVQAQQSQIGKKVIFMGRESSHPLVLLQIAVDKAKVKMEFKQGENEVHSVLMDGEVLAQGSYTNKQVAKGALAEEAVNKLKEECFFIVKKEGYEEISTVNLQKKSEEFAEVGESSAAPVISDKAHEMMLKMGWKGQGLGVNEQGDAETVAEKIQNISRDGLGGPTGNILWEVQKILSKFANSDRLSVLAFDPTFTKEERAHIHKLAQKFNLKSRSESKGEARRITISKKICLLPLVKNLLREGGESPAYKLIVPEKFKHLWTEEPTSSMNAFRTEFDSDSDSD